MQKESDQESDFEDFEDKEENQEINQRSEDSNSEEDDSEESRQKKQKTTNQKNAKTKSSLKRQSKEELKGQVNQMMTNLNKKTQDQEKSTKVFNLVLTQISTAGQRTPIYKNTELYYPSNPEIYDRIQMYTEHQDGTHEIKEFEKICALPTVIGSELAEYCLIKEKDRIKDIIKEEALKRNPRLGEPNSLDIKVLQQEVDRKKDLLGSNPYSNFSSNFYESQRLNSFEFYQEMLKSFCNQLNCEALGTEKNVQSKNKSILSDMQLENAHFDRTESQRENGVARKEYKNPFSLMGTPMNDGDYMLNERSRMKTPLAGTLAMSPESIHGKETKEINPFDSFHSFEGSFRQNSLRISNNEVSFHRNQSKQSTHTNNFGNSQRIAQKSNVYGTQNQPKNTNFETERKINNNFYRYVKMLSENGTLSGINYLNLLSKKNKLGDSSVFKFSVVQDDQEIEEDQSKLLNSRCTNQAYLDYIAPQLGAKKRLKQQNLRIENLNYSNKDLVYSTWHDNKVKELNEGQQQDRYNGNLLIDLNDQTVVYSKLVDKINKQQNPGLGKESEQDINQHPAGEFEGEKDYDRNSSKMKGKKMKDLRIFLAKVRGRGDDQDNYQSELQNENMLEATNEILKLTNNQNSTKISSAAKKRRKIVNYKHSEVADGFHLNELHMSQSLVFMLHRFDLTTTIQNDFAQRNHHMWRAKIVNLNEKNHPLQAIKKKRNLIDDESKEMQHSYQIFKKVKKLSLKSDDFFLFEYIEKDPLMLSNPGMTSRLTQYYYPTRVTSQIHNLKGKNLDPNEKIQEFKKLVTSNLGEYGEHVQLAKTDQIPLLGQLTKNEQIGITVVENNMMRMPVFPQTPKKTDFILVRTIYNGKIKYFLRKIKTIYTTGQIQPKVEVFCPYSRQFTLFLKKLMKYYITKSFDEKKYILLDELKEFLPSINDHNLRKTIKMLGGEQDVYDTKLYRFNESLLAENKANDFNGEMEASITPEDLCLYERMHKSYYQLRDFGIEKLKSSDKINNIKTKFYKKNFASPRKCVIARRIIEELYLSAWNISQSFLQAIQTQSRMYLSGYGDPTNNNGGMNFIKMPLKISRYESKLFNKNKPSKSSTMVTGTDADLRRQNMKFVHEKLKENGYPEEVIAGLQRWDKICILREISNKHIKSGNPDPDLEKFSRNMRMTTQDQKVKYQNEINRRLAVMIDKIGNAKPEEIESDDEMDLVEDLESLLKTEEEELKKYNKLLTKSGKARNKTNDGSSGSSGEDESLEDDEDDDGDESVVQSIRDMEDDIEFD